MKVIQQMTDAEEVQVLNYLKATGLRVGLLMNFGQRSLKYKRLIQG
jgi:GxxExxY protein